jgi:hypothetical protein
MSHWAQLDENNKVINVLVGDNDSPDEGYQWLIDNLGGRWIQTSINTRGGVHYNPETGEPSEDQSKALRGNYACIDFTYDEERNAFISPKPYASWLLNEETYQWEAPIPEPPFLEGFNGIWNEETLSWEKVPIE